MSIYQSGIASLIAALFDDLKFGDIISDLVSWDPKQCCFSSGLRVKAMLINLFVASKPLYKVHAGYKQLDTENLFGQGVNPKDFKDYSLARTLDKLAEANPKKIYSTLARQIVINEEVDISSCHIDTTSILVAGNYEDQEPDNDDIFKLAYGCNKKGKNAVKQYKYGLVVTKDRIPILADVFSGKETIKVGTLKTSAPLKMLFLLP